MKKIILGILVSCFAASLSLANNGPKRTEMPKNKLPSMDQKAFIAAMEGQEQFDGKTILKVHALEAWTSSRNEGTRQTGIKQYRELLTVVAVYDPANKKCWLWNTVQFRKYAPSDELEFYVADNDADEIDCKAAGYSK
jgi:hypothetical protein